MEVPSTATCKETSANVHTSLPKWVNLIQLCVLEKNTLGNNVIIDVTCLFCCALLLAVAASGGSAYVYQMAAALLRNPTGQVLLAAWIAALAGLVAWYLI